MAPALLSLQGIRLTISGKPLLEGADLSLQPGERLCLVGRNGSGKSTLLRIAAGEIDMDAGTRFLQPGAGIRCLAQEPDFGDAATVLDYVAAGLNPGDDIYAARQIIEELGLTGAEHPSHLSGGEARRAALARVLAPEPDILLLDEPTNHLDLPTIEWLEGKLASLRCAMVLISHDRRFLQNLSRSTLWIDRGVTRRIDRGFAHFESWRDAVLQEEEAERHKLDRRIVNEEHWVRYGVTARRKRNQGRMARLADLRREKREARRAAGTLKISASEARTSGRLVIEAEDISKAFGGRTIVKNFSIRVARGDRAGVMGANGSGKTTLVKMLTGELAPDTGEVTPGANVALAVLDQRRMSLDPLTTLSDTLTGGGSDYVLVNGGRKHVVGYMRDFLFAPEQARTPVGKLSGGERGRLALARALAQPANLLVLDEPTNDLDLETLDLLQEFLADYPGTLILVSHDRDFTDRVVTSTLAPEGGGRWGEYAGGYSDMMAQKGADQTLLLPVKAGAKTSAAPRSERVSRRRMGFKEKHALETLPARIEALRSETAVLQRKLDDPGLYRRDGAKFARLSHALADAQAALAKAEDEWLQLEILREELEA